ncbi:protein ITPRID1 isoform X2 [Megalops cyprinoides]|uniref:protein ITPRID1 isoform X2 n=1 Tax=Megalops cyprinoides TaxID=118141 RepID=UPI0018642152|nr:protein ITPRID1 isoform X2 [Megalops cyprinoides]
MLTMIPTDCGFDKRASLVASKARWSRVDEPSSDHLMTRGKAGDCKRDSIHQWLISSCQQYAKPDSTQETTELLRRHTSGEDDLVLGVEASLYGKSTALKTVQEFLRCQQVPPALSRWNSVTSAVSTNSALSVMDVLNLWQDDPEELLLDLGFGCDEPDISVKIPARFINHPSKARGINIQVFLEAQKNRMDVENPDVSNRFRQLEVLQQVTSAFSSLVGGTPVTPPPSGERSVASTDQPLGAGEKRKRLSMLLRRASKKTLSMAQSEPDMPLPPAASQEPAPGLHPTTSDRRTALKRGRPGIPENGCLSPLVEEQSPPPSRDTSDPPPAPSALTEGNLRVRPGRDPPCVVPIIPYRRKSPGELKTPESFEMEEVHSFDEGSITGLAEGTEGGVMRTNSCQSDSSGFLEEPCIPALSQQNSPVPELMKALYAMSGDSTDSQSAQKEGPDLHCVSSQGHQGAESAQPAESACTEARHGAPEREGEEMSGVLQVPPEGSSSETEAGPRLVHTPGADRADEGTAPLGGEDGDGVTGTGLEQDWGADITITESQKAEEPATPEETGTLLSDNAVSDPQLQGESQAQTWGAQPEEECQISRVSLSGEESSAKAAPMAQSGSEEGCGQQEGFLRRSLSGVGRADPPAASRQTSGETSDRATPSQPGFGPARSVSVQMPSSLGPVSQLAHRRGVAEPPAPRSQRDSFCRKAWSDAGGCRASNLCQELAVAEAMTREQTTPPRRRLSLGSRGSSRTRSASLDTGLAHEDDEGDADTGVGVSGHWGRGFLVGGGRCCQCGHRCTSCSQHTHCPAGESCSKELEILHYAASQSAAFPYSLDELEGMMRCVRRFRSILEEIEERLTEEQAQVYSILSDLDSRCTDSWMSSPTCAHS